MTRAGFGAGLLTLLLVTSACSGEPDRPGSSTSSGTPTPSASASASGAAGSCQETSATLIRAVQRYVDGYGAPVRGQAPERDEERPAAGDNEDLQAVLDRSQAELRTLGCDLDTFRTELEHGLEGVRARGPLAAAVLLRLRATMTGAAATEPETVTVRPGDDLPAVLARLAPESTVRMARGRYQLDETLVLLQAVTLRGVHRDRAVIRSTAAGSALLVLTDGRVELRDLTLRHTGRSPASVLLGGPTSSVVLTGARLAGATGRDGQGGNGVLMTAGQGEERGRGTTLEVTGTEFRGNAAAGVLLTGGHRASVRRASFRGNGQCGVCFMDASSGAVRGSRFTDNDVGVAVLGRAAPVIVAGRFRGGEVGVQASERSRPLVRDVTVDGAARAAMIFSERATGRVDASACSDVPYGIVIAGRALPFLGDNDCTVARSG